MTKHTADMTTPELVDEYTEAKMRGARGERPTDAQHSRHCYVVDELRRRCVLS